ncbi:S-layer homology domain-containing protein [Mesobacillus jeotgali]|uniref:S-layer homology domain-containing protein n=1 Tax=Mesobacillus jeotgali TaxID=129985 RepID=UPI00178581AE|nr:S-layer homology domain-containing protein [Mesobacillus jeotgali]UYZ21805.1 S-layer homology domain-containing protein [Mesobacillus jeotgali]
MKRYPFSNKAIKAIIAASIALSPLAPTSHLLTTTVHAGETASDTAAIERITLIYSQFTPDQEVIFNKAAAGFKHPAKFTTQDWTEVISSAVSEKVNSQLSDGVTAEKIAMKLATLLYDANESTISTNYTAFKNSAEGQAFESVMGAGSIDLILEFIVDAEKKLWEKPLADILEALENGSIEAIAVEIRDELIKEAKYAELNTKLATKTGTNLEGLFQIKNRINNKLVSKGIITSAEQGILRDAFIDAAYSAGNPNTLPPTNEDPTVISLPKGAAEVVREKNPSGKVEVITKVMPEKVADIVSIITAEKDTVEVVLEAAASGEKAKAEVPASLFTEAVKKNENTIIEISTPEASYKIPASEINIAELAAKLGTTADNVKINISVNPVNKTVKDLNLASDVIDFTIEAVAGTKKESITKFSQYVEREITGDKDFNKAKSVAVRLNSNGTFSAIPTLFDGKTATVKSLTNSEYTIVENSKTFKDVKSGWAKEYIETLASKYIVYGKATGEYEPGKHMTRAEFAVLLVRALGLPTEKYDGSFKDVKGIEWFAKTGELTAAVQYGVIKGMGDGTFAPNEKITRAQAAAMIERAMKISFVKYDFSQLDKTKTLKDFKDANQVGSWAIAGVEAVYQAGIVKGKGNSTFDPNGYTQRNEMAAILANFLVSAELLDK